MAKMLIFCFVVFFILSATLVESSPILISEVFYDTPGTKFPESKEEWIELYNPTSSDIDISGYVIEDNTSPGNYYQVSSGKTIPAESVIIIARSTVGFKGLGYGFDPYIDDFDLGLNNGGDFLILRDALGGNQIDMVAWKGGAGSYPTWTISADHSGSNYYSLKRIAFGAPDPSVWASNQNPNPGSPAPLPEPSTIILLGSGLIGLVGILSQRRKRREVD